MLHWPHTGYELQIFFVRLPSRISKSCSPGVLKSSQWLQSKWTLALVLPQTFADKKLSSWMSLQVIMRTLQDCAFQPYANPQRQDQIYQKSTPKSPRQQCQQILMFVNIAEHSYYIVFWNPFWKSLLQSKFSWVSAELDWILSLYDIEVLPFLTLISP